MVSVFIVFFSESTIAEPYLKPVEAKVEAPMVTSTPVSTPAASVPAPQQPTLEFPAPPSRMQQPPTPAVETRSEPAKPVESPEKRVFTLYDNTTTEPTATAVPEQRNEVSEVRLSPAEHQNRGTTRSQGARSEHASAHTERLERPRT